MITEEKIHLYQKNNRLDELFEGCLCGGDDFGVFYLENKVYKIHHYDSDNGYELHPDLEILSSLDDKRFFPKLIAGGMGYVCMTYEDGMFWDEYLEVEGKVPSWSKDLIEEAIKYIINKGYNPIELEPRHVLINDEDHSIKIIDVTAYEEISSDKLTEEYKIDLFQSYISLFV